MSINNACDINDLEKLNITWLNVLPVARRFVDKDLVKITDSATISDFIGFKFKNHDALEDANALTAKIMLRAIEEKYCNK